jgi:translation initiation factor 2 subunit 2
MPEQYTIDMLMNRAYEQLNEIALNKEKVTIDDPVIISQGGKRIVYKNFVTTCEKLKREPDDVQSFFTKELVTETSINGLGGLVIKGKYKMQPLLSLMMKYIEQNVTCRECKSDNTSLRKDTGKRFMKCDTCLSEKCID